MEKNGEGRWLADRLSRDETFVSSVGNLEQFLQIYFDLLLWWWLDNKKTQNYNKKNGT